MVAKKERAEKSEMLQVREYVKKFKINIERCNTDTIKMDNEFEKDRKEDRKSSEKWY